MRNKAFVNDRSSSHGGNLVSSTSSMAASSPSCSSARVHAPSQNILDMYDLTLRSNDSWLCQHTCNSECPSKIFVNKNSAINHMYKKAMHPACNVNSGCPMYGTARSSFLDHLNSHYFHQMVASRSSTPSSSPGGDDAHKSHINAKNAPSPTLQRSSERLQDKKSAQNSREERNSLFYQNFITYNDDCAFGDADFGADDYQPRKRKRLSSSSPSSSSSFSSPARADKPPKAAAALDHFPALPSSPPSSSPPSSSSTGSRNLSASALALLPLSPPFQCRHTCSSTCISYMFYNRDSCIDHMFTTHFNCNDRCPMFTVEKHQFYKLESLVDKRVTNNHHQTTTTATPTNHPPSSSSYSSSSSPSSSFPPSFRPFTPSHHTSSDIAPPSAPSSSSFSSPSASSPQQRAASPNVYINKSNIKYTPSHNQTSPPQHRPPLHPSQPQATQHKSSPNSTPKLSSSSAAAAPPASSSSSSTPILSMDSLMNRVDTLLESFVHSLMSENLSLKHENTALKSQYSSLQQHADEMKQSLDESKERNEKFKKLLVEYRLRVAEYEGGNNNNVNNSNHHH